MPNMPYCRFQNTLENLRDCEDALDEIIGNNNTEMRDALSENEAGAIMEMIDACARISDKYADNFTRRQLLDTFSKLFKEE